MRNLWSVAVLWAELWPSEKLSIRFYASPRQYRGHAALRIEREAQEQEEREQGEKREGGERKEEAAKRERDR